MHGTLPGEMNRRDTIHFGSYAPQISRCVNVKSGHGSKGHQQQNGAVFAVGDYMSKFSFEAYREEFEATVYYRLKYLMDLLLERTQAGERQDAAAASIHREETLLEFYDKTARYGVKRFHNHSLCPCCLSNHPEHALPCGHIICTACVKMYGQIRARTVIEINQCPLEADISGFPPWTVHLYPESAGCRILTLDG
jgi:hypothetical protein